MSKTTYTLKKNTNTGQFHLFEGKLNPPNSKNKCTSESFSICEKMKWVSGSKDISCEVDESIVRVKCAQLGRAVCGICVSHLYADPE
ncbi:hypothetical protein [Acinetobacter brisouii]|uniref:hypothetical protein n=1 Tax=Acinetobacter brisouii TaxID=396323 RepID=UPI0009D77B81|nr:hypothetical protein [Acinetobacter brisouii]